MIARGESAMKIIHGLIAGSGLAALALATCVIAQTSTYPNKPIRLIVPVAEADAPDSLAAGPFAGGARRPLGFIRHSSTSRKVIRANQSDSSCLSHPAAVQI